jgi:hypothetical protein
MIINSSDNIQESKLNTDGTNDVQVAWSVKDVLDLGKGIVDFLRGLVGLRNDVNSMDNSIFKDLSPKGKEQVKEHLASIDFLSDRDKVTERFGPLTPANQAYIREQMLKHMQGLQSVLKNELQRYEFQGSANTDKLKKSIEVLGKMIEQVRRNPNYVPPTLSQRENQNPDTQAVNISPKDAAILAGAAFALQNRSLWQDPEKLVQAVETYLERSHPTFSQASNSFKQEVLTEALKYAQEQQHAYPALSAAQHLSTPEIGGRL